MNHRDSGNGVRAGTILRRMTLIAAFFAGVLIPITIGELPNRMFLGKAREVQRLAVPGSNVDAVLVEADSTLDRGARWRVLIVKHGAVAERGRTILVARDLVRPKLVWNKAGLLEIAYDRARIDHFTNVWVPRGPSGGRAIEIMLVPSSPGFSCLIASSSGALKLPE